MNRENNYHRPLRGLENRKDRAERETMSDDEGCIAVGGLAVRLGMLKGGKSPEFPTLEQPSVAGLAGISTLTQLVRRDAQQNREQFAAKAGLTVEDVVSIESCAKAPEPRVLFLLSKALNVSYQKLLSLAGHLQQRNQNLEHDVLRYAASSAPMDKLNGSEAQALHDLLRILHE